MINYPSMKRFLLIILLLTPQLTLAASNNLQFNMPSNYTRGQTVEISITNTSTTPIIIPENGNCHKFFSIYDSSGRALNLSDPNQMCTLDYRMLTIAPQETKMLGSWDQQYYVYCPPNANCLVSTLQVQDGTYNIRVLVQDQNYSEFPIHISAANTTFSDVPTSHWAYQFIQNLYSKGIVQGYGNGQFGPNNHITRAEVIKMAIKSAELKTLGSSIADDTRCYTSSPTDLSSNYPIDRCGIPSLPYLDVTPRHPLYPYIYAAYSKGIIKSSTYFYPDQKASRIECLQYIVDAFGQTPSNTTLNSTPAFSDVANTAERAYTDSAKAAGIISGSNGQFYPNQSVTRAEISKILSNMLN